MKGLPLRLPLPALAAVAILLAGCATEKAPPSPPTASLIAEPHDAPVAQILAVHGFNDHRTAFSGLAAHAADHGIRFEAYDQQGFGANDNRGLWPGLDLLTRDLARRLKEARAARPDIPLYLLGESMGGAVGVVTLAGHPDLPVDGLILSAPAVWGGDAMNPFYRLALWTVARIAPGMKLTGEGLGKQASDNIAMLRALGADPLFIRETRVDAIEGLVGLMRQAREDGPRLHLPRLVLAGTRDEIVPPEALASFIATLDPADCISVTYEDGWHMLLRDLQRRSAWKDITDWIGQKRHLDPRPDVHACGDAEPVAGS